MVQISLYIPIYKCFLLYAEEGSKRCFSKEVLRGEKMSLLKSCKINTSAFWVFEYKRFKNILTFHLKKRVTERQQTYLLVNSQCFFINKFQNPLLPPCHKGLSCSHKSSEIRSANSHNTERNYACKSFTRRFCMHLIETLHFILLAIYRLGFSLVFSDRP